MTWTHGTRDSLPWIGRQPDLRFSERKLQDNTIEALHRALSGLSTRQRVIADNIANVETPGFLAGQVSFEDSLASAVAKGNPDGTQIAVTRTNDPVNFNGNNVSIDKETLALSETNLRYQAGIESINAKFRLLRTAIRGQ
jgi:flagellar basal-body rod protein FlgB